MQACLNKENAIYSTFAHISFCVHESMSLHLNCSANLLPGPLFAMHLTAKTRSLLLLLSYLGIVLGYDTSALVIGKIIARLCLLVHI